MRGQLIPYIRLSEYFQMGTTRPEIEQIMVVETEHPTLGTIRTLGSPIKMSATPPVVGRPAPLLGEHTREVLEELGYDSQAVAAIMAGR